MNRRVLILLISAFLACFSGSGQTPSAAGTPPPLLASPDAQGGMPAAETLKFKMYAVMAQKASGDKAPPSAELKPVESLLKSLPYTRYEAITVSEQETPDGKETEFPINAAYTLVVRPDGRDEKGAARLDIHVDLMQEGKLVKALTAQAAAKAGDALLLRGMPLAPGELVIVLQRDRGDQNGQGQQNSQDQQQEQDKQEQQKAQNDNTPEQKEQDKEQEQQQQDKKEREKKEQEKKDAQAEQQKPDEGEQEPSAEDKPEEASEKKETNNLESLLQSLEEVDRKEQAEVRNKRDRIDFKGDWW